MHPNTLKLVYTVCALVMAALWALAYWRVRPLRRELVWVGLAALPGSILLEVTLWTRDWWTPPSILNLPPPTPTDFLYAFFNNSLMSLVATLALYRLFGGEQIAVTPPPSLAVRLAPYAIMTLVPYPLYWLGMHSAWATLVATLVALVAMFALRRDLIGTSLASGAAAFAVGVLSFQFLGPLFPGFVQVFWMTDKLSGIYLGYGPIEDLTWYAYTGAFFGIYYKFWHGLRVQATHPAPAPQPAAGRAI